MAKKTVNCIFFSPTGSARNIVCSISKGFSNRQESLIDLTYPRYIEKKEIDPRSFSLIAVPVYAGRVPELAYERLRILDGKGTECAVIVVYGNRAYDDALLELYEIAKELDFIPVAAAAFIGEHSFSTPEKPIAAGRPDNEDIEKAKEFGRQIAEKLKTSKRSSLRLKGNYPFREKMAKMGFTPETVESKCTRCGTCISVCPSEAIELKNTLHTDVEKCVLCMACIRNCPEHARIIENSRLKSFTELLYVTCAERKEPEFFI